MRIASNSECVRSKYFEGQTDMDESLSDFQEVKKNCKGPKVAQKPAKPKAKKVTKRIKGQKDIRTALKGKKNELVSYTKEYDTVCKKSGLDVDSEQLQLAIALSKSLQTESNNPESSQTLSSQQRVAKIRKTLQEYGFKVPEAKITAGKRTKKFRKKYKLLTVTEEEKRQDITEKYTRILFENLDRSKVEQDTSDNENLDAKAYYVATNTPYECMKDDNIFYVNNLVEKSTTNGSLLRDWSSIPGRPESPKLLDTYIMNFKEIDCSQDELDIILSGPIKSVKDIFTSKEKEYKKKYKICDVPKLVIEDEEKIVSIDNDKGHEIDVIENKSPLQKVFTMNSPSTIVLDVRSPVKRLFEDRILVSEEIEIISPIKQTMVDSPSKDITDVGSSTKLTYTQQYRSCSPDIFDDELSSIMETTKPIILLSQEHKTKVFSQEIMDLTQCVDIAYTQKSDKGIQLSQNVTKRRSNDFMEITECIVGSPQHLELKEIDLTQSPEDKGAIIVGNQSINLDNVNINFTNDTEQNSPNISQNVTDEQQITVVLNHSNTETLQTAKENIDLTQSSNEDDKGTAIEGNIQTPNKKVVESMDLTQSSNSTDCDDLPLVDVANTQSQTPLDDTIIVDKDEYIANGKVKKPTFKNEAQNQVFDLTQGHNTLEYNLSPVKVVNTESCSFYEDFAYDHHSENSKENETIDVSKDNNISHSESKESNDDIDLTQGSNTSEEIHMSQRPVPENIPNNSSLGKKDDVSIDYDEVIIEDNIGEKESFKESEIDSSVTEHYNLLKSEVHNDIEIVPNDDVDTNSSQNSEIFQISDKELDYSLHRSRRDCLRDNFDIGGISILNNVTKTCSLRKSLSEGCSTIYAEYKNDTNEESFLPEVILKRVEKCAKTIEFETLTTEGISPIKVQEILKSNDGIFNIKTPKNTEYVIKTVDVTPIADFASMSTPQRNRELDRYGLKPFKRKRAIQILTHIYNQTHPTIQQLLDEDQPSPSKKPRIITYNDSSPKKVIISPSKENTGCLKTPVKSPRKFILRKPRHETRQHTSPKSTDELDRDRHISSAPSSNNTDELEKDRDILFASSSKNSHMLERDRDSLSGPSSTKTDAIKDGTDGYEVSNESAVVKSTDCSPDDWVFQKREKAKVHSCRVPLHIAFHNYVLSRRTLREAILKYEPVNIDVIHKDLVGYGHRYDPKDLLKFLDKKCITVKTTDNNTRNIKK